MHSSGDAESIRHFQSQPSWPFTDVVQREQPTDSRLRVALRRPDLTRRAKHWQSGIIEKFVTPRAEKSAAGFFMSEQLP
jgi:hypothetical protein